MEEELARAKQCLEENVERIEQATVRLDGAGKSDIPPEVLETSLAKCTRARPSASCTLLAFSCPNWRHGQ